MFSLIAEVLQTGIKLLTDLFSGGLSDYYYICCIGFALYILVYCYFEQRSAFTAAGYLKSIAVEAASHLAFWTAAILIARFFAGIIAQGVSPAEDDTYYTLGLLMLISYDLSVFLSLITRKLNVSRDAGEISSFLFGLVMTYVIFLTADRYGIKAFTLSVPYSVTLSVVTAIFAVLFKLSQRKEFASVNPDAQAGCAPGWKPPAAGEPQSGTPDQA